MRSPALAADASEPAITAVRQPTRASRAEYAIAACGRTMRSELAVARLMAQPSQRPNALSSCVTLERECCFGGDPQRIRGVLLRAKLARVRPPALGDRR